MDRGTEWIGAGLARLAVLLGDTLRQALRSKAGCRKVIEWLKMLENNGATRVQRTGKPVYDGNWMWRELGLEDERY